MIVYKFGYGGSADSPDISPFVVKLETWLRMSNLPYETRIGNVAKMPKHKLPVALIDGKLIADSSLIIEHLQDRYPEALNDNHLRPLQRAQSVAIKALFETHIYFVGLYLRWGIDRNMDIYRPMLVDYAAHSAPSFARPIVPLFAPLVLPFVRRKIMRQAWEQGIGRHSQEEIVRMGMAAWAAVADLLGEQTYLLGDRPSTVDATAFAWIHAGFVHPFDGPIRNYIASQPHLVAYHDRIWQRYWAHPT
ncbi:glutathione S-transferase family protein [Paraburkholderia panacisoli]|uniref:Glutathione S-transferase family protein n=1 Tax=Paraburkholderia panacisoli TaxID=2603818 RepID=A0A5B0G3E5_9BURK|nr:glutathione S-transferase family protein [Paraburkholderia panacisoli]KAA0997916.1 glutathione S-transferase family protein [Paraburkholderia panacisoli]